MSEPAHKRITLAPFVGKALVDRLAAAAVAVVAVVERVVAGSSDRALLFALDALDVADGVLSGGVVLHIQILPCSDTTVKHQYCQSRKRPLEWERAGRPNPERSSGPLQAQQPHAPLRRRAQVPTRPEGGQLLAHDAGGGREMDQ